MPKVDLDYCSNGNLQFDYSISKTSQLKWLMMLEEGWGGGKGEGVKAQKSGESNIMQLFEEKNHI